MSKTVKVFLIIAACFVTFGLVLAGVGYATGGMAPIIIMERGGALKVVDTGNLKETDLIDEKIPAGEVKDLVINTDRLTKITITEQTDEAGINKDVTDDAAGNNPKYIQVVGRNHIAYGGIAVDYTAENAMVTITSKTSGISLFGFWNLLDEADEQRSYLEIIVPKGMTFDSVLIKANMPRVSVSGLSAKDLDVHCNMGSLTMENVNAGKLKAGADAGMVKLLRSKAQELDVKADLGMVKMNQVTADFADISLSAGSAELSNLETGGLRLKSDIGSVELGGVLKGESSISCNMGSVKLNLRQPRNSLALDVKTDIGAAYVNGEELDRESYSENEIKGWLKVSADMGSVHVNFLE